MIRKIMMLGIALIISGCSTEQKLYNSQNKIEKELKKQMDKTNEVHDKIRLELKNPPKINSKTHREARSSFVKLST